MLSYSELLQRLSCIEDSISFYKEHNLLNLDRKCPKCYTIHAMKLERDKNCIDNFVLRCSSRICRKKLSIRNGSFFEGSKLSLSDNMKFIFLWVHKVSGELLQLETNIKSQTTTVDYRQFCRDICVGFLHTKSKEKIGGVGKVVEIDESKF
jgi:hypothetical protein